MLIRRPIQKWIPSLRECIVARKGFLLGSTDYEMGELVTHAQNCLIVVGESELATALVAGVKPHPKLGASMIGVEYARFIKMYEEGDKSAKDARQAAKPGNFGFPGGMSEARLVLQQRKQGPDTHCENSPFFIDDKGTRGYRGLRFCILMNGAKTCGDRKVTMWGKSGYERPIPPTCVECLECAKKLRDAWFETWPENRKYFRVISDWTENGQLLDDGTRLAPGELMQHSSGIIRGGTGFTDGANGFFQSLLGRVAKSAVRIAQRECCDKTVRVPSMAHENSKVSKYANGKSPLFGSRVIVLQHDELMTEMPEGVAHDAVTRTSEIMCEELRHFCPDVAAAVNAEPTLMRAWYKQATPKWERGGKKAADENDKLVPWEP